MTTIVYGNFHHSLDDKNRVRIPSKIKDAFSATLFLVPGRTGCLYLVAEDKIEAFVSKFINTDPFSDDDINDISTAFFSATEELKEDAQGRILLKDSIKKIAGINKDIVFVGKGNYAEIWPAEEYDRKFGVLNPTKISDMLAQLKNRGN